MRTMQAVTACVLVLICVWGPDVSAQIPQQAGRRILIAADESSLQFRSTPRVRDSISQALRAIGRHGDTVRIVATGGPRTAVPDTTIGKVVGKALGPRAVASATPSSSDANELRLRADLSSSAVAAALRSLSEVGSGPIVILYFTEGYPGFVPEPSEFIQEALRLNATTHVIDPRRWDEPAEKGNRVEPWDAKDWDAYVAATRDNVRALAARTNGNAVFTRNEFEAVLSSLAPIAPSLD